MNETDDTQPPVPNNNTAGGTPDEQPTQALGQPAAPNATPSSSPEQPTQAFGDPAPAAAPGYQPPAAPQYSYPPPGASYPPPGAAYPPPGASYPPPGSSYPPPGYQATMTPPRPIRRLTRSRSERVIGGVCGGLARYWNTDPLLLRILTVVLTLATGGAFLVGYLIAWIAIPDEPMAPQAPFGQPADQVGYASGGNPSYADYTSEYVPPAPRERSYLGWLVLSAAVLAAGVLGLLGFLVPTSVAFWGVTLSVALTILGIGLLVGTRYGRARWLLWLAIPLAFVTFATVSASNFVRDNPDWDRWTATTGEDGGWGGLTIGDRTWAVDPADAAESPLDFQLSAGTAVLDLTDLTALGTEDPVDPVQPVTIEAGVGVGELIILVPLDMQVDLTGSVNLGQIKVPGKSLTEGTDLDVQTTINPLAGSEPAYSVTIDAAVGAGNLEVRREAA